MARVFTCPMCDEKCKALCDYDRSGHKFVSFQCKCMNRLIQLEQKVIDLNDSATQSYYTLIINDVLNRRCDDPRRLYYVLYKTENDNDPQDIVVGINTVMSWKTDHVSKVEHALMNIYRMFGEKVFVLNSTIGMRCVLSCNMDESISMENSLLNFGYIAKAESPWDAGKYIISKEGWHRINELHRKESDMTGFIAISFDEKTSEIREIIKESISETGFEPILIDEVEHNNQIVPEIKKYIERCRFLVMDCTIPNLGAYYEAGMASGYGKEVIICCRKNEFSSENGRPHFDVAQQSMIIWSNYDDLKKKLVKRIDATIDDAKNDRLFSNHIKS